MFTCKASLSLADAKGQLFSTKSILISAVLIVTDCPFTVRVLVLLYALTTSTTSPALSDLGGGVCSTICIGPFRVKVGPSDEQRTLIGLFPSAGAHSELYERPEVQLVGCSSNLVCSVERYVRDISLKHSR